MTPGASDDAWAPPPSPQIEHRPLVVLPGYEEFRPIARGGSSDVYSAVQVTTRRPVAVKVVHLRDTEAVRHFERELEITVRLGRQHPNIVTVLDTGFTAEGLPCLVMELADLGSVDARLREVGPLPVGDVVALGTVIADALAFAHQQGVLHRDVKPPNILVLPTTYVLTDFGIARTLDAGHSASMELFSYRHAAPQVLDGELPVAADDVYSLGSTMHTLLTGRAPFAGATPDEDSALAYLRRARTTVAPPLSRPDVPAELSDLTRRCLANDRTQRPTAQELHRLLLAVPTEQRGWAAAPPVLAEPVLAPTPAPTPLPLREVSPERDAALAATAQALGGSAAPPPEQTVGMRAEPPRATEPGHTSKRPWLPWVAALVLLLAGVGALLVTHHSSKKLARPTVTRVSPIVVASSSPTPTTSAASAAPLAAPRLISAKHDGVKVRLHWNDPSGGTDTFVVVQLIDGMNETFPETARGITQLSVTPHAATPACFQVVALNGHAQAASQSICLS